MNNIKVLIGILLIMSFILPYGLSAQQNSRVEILGKVVDPEGEPLIGVTVIVKNQPGFGVVSDVDGKFKITAGAYDVLVLTYLGFESQEIPVLKIEDTKNLKVQMKESTEVLDEVIVTASGLQKKITMTGAVTNVDVKSLRSPGVNLSNSLAGAVPGIIAMQTSGEPGADFSEVTIRGVSTYGANRGVLFLVDGVERSFNEIPIYDIEDISVLKDASATAMYGARGANGVILITTKVGEKGKIKISGNIQAGYDQMGSYPEFADANTYARLANEAKTARYENPLYTNEELTIIEQGLDPELYPSVYWRDLLLKNGAPAMKANVNFSGGGDNATYFVSLGYLNQQGIYKTNDRENAYETNKTYERYNYRTNVNINLTRTTLLDVKIGGWLVNETSPGSGTGDIWNSFNRLTPLAVPRKLNDGKIPITFLRDGTTAQLSPEVLLTRTGYDTKWHNTMQTSVGLRHNFDGVAKGLVFNASFAFDLANDNTVMRRKMPELWRAERKRNEKGELVFITKPYQQEQLMSQSSSTSGNRKYYGEANLKYDKTIGEKHKIQLFGMAYMEEKSITNHDGNIINSIPKRNAAFSGSTHYVFLDRYIVDFNFGYTGSENFERGKKFGFFPAISGAWIISEEPLIKNNLKWLNLLKVKGSYGEIGNDQIGGMRFPFVTLIGSLDAGYGFGEYGSNKYNGYRITRIGTPNLTWEVAKKYNVGFDLGLFNDMITTTIDFYKDRRENIFMQRGHMPLTTGLADQVPMANVGEMESTGFDASFAFASKIEKINFRLGANVTYQNNEIIDQDEAANELWYKMSKGFRYAQTRGLIAMGLFENQEDIDSSPKHNLGRTPLPGDIKYKDVNGDGVVNNDDIVPLGYRTQPGIQYGFTLNADWNNFELNVLFQGDGKRDFFVGGSGPHAFSQRETGNILQIMADDNRWIPSEISGTTATEDPNANWPRLTYGNNDHNNRQSTFWLRNGKYLRLRNLEVAYNIPASFLRKFHLSTVRLGFLGENLYTWKPFKWWDPESNSEDGARYPISKKFHFYVNFSF